MALQLVKATLRQSYLGKNVNNVFFYHVNSDDDDKARQVAQAFESQMLTPINGMQNNQALNQSIYAVNMSNLADYWTEALTGNGTRGTEATANPPFVSFNYTIAPNPSVIRHGYKRFTGVDESFVLGGVFNDGFNTEAVALATAIVNGLTLGPLYPAVPVIARILSVDPALVYSFATIAGCVLKGVSTQNTRK